MPYPAQQASAAPEAQTAEVRALAEEVHVEIGDDVGKAVRIFQLPGVPVGGGHAEPVREYRAAGQEQLEHALLCRAPDWTACPTMQTTAREGPRPVAGRRRGSRASTAAHTR